MALDKDIRCLSMVPLFAGMEPDALRLMAFAAERSAPRAGDTIFAAGDAADGALVIVSGTVELMRSGENQGPARAVGPGSLLGEHALLAATVRPVTARARSAAILLKISRALFTRVLEEYPANAVAIRRRWAAQLARRLGT